jgi:hypothetical protein
MADSPFGSITNPLPEINSQGYGDLFGVGGQAGGLIDFISNILKLVTVVAGLFAFINLILAGFTYISSGSDPKSTQAAMAKINMSLIGLVIIAASYAIAAIAGLVIFGDSTAILTPVIYGPGVSPTGPPPGNR